MSDDAKADSSKVESEKIESSRTESTTTAPSMSGASRRTFLKTAALGTAAAVLAFPRSTVMGANDRVRVGMIGVGDRGSELLKQIRDVSGVELVAMADVYSRRRDDVKGKVPGIQTFADYRQLLDMKDVDAVIVASPLHIHRRHFVDVLAAGKDLYSEKTMAWSIEEADACLAAAQKSNRVVQIGLQHQSSGAQADAKQWIKEGRLGKVTSVESFMGRNTPRGHGQWVRQVPSDCTAQNVDWKAFLNGRPDRPFDAFRLINWRLFWEFSGGNCAENMVHQIAWIMGALDLPLPSAAYMSGGVFSEKDGREVPDTIAVTLDFPKDIVVTWQSTFSNKHYGLGDRILGSDGTLEHHFEEPLQYWPEDTNSHGDDTKGKSKNQNHMQNWIDCVRSRATPNAPAEMGYRSAVAVHMANLSYRNKRRLTFDEAKAIKPEFS
jgi:predicted dehydrogenase